MTKPIHYILLGLAIIAIVLLIIYWNEIRDFFTSSDTSQADYDKCINDHKLLPDGSDCSFCTEPSNRYAKGVIKNGACVIQDQTPVISDTESKVSNPNGAFMYYQTDLASGGKLYSKSNIVIPMGTKVNVMKVWQTNTNNQPLAGYYETDLKQYGPTSGFFDIKDVTKI